MSTLSKRRTGIARTAGALATAVAALALPFGTGAAHAAAPTASRADWALPPGVIKLQDGEPCPPATLCLYRDYGNAGPAYGIGAGFNVDLRNLPMLGSGGPTAANNVSSWVNHTASSAVLVDIESQQLRPLSPGQELQEPPLSNDTVDAVGWPG